MVDLKGEEDETETPMDIIPRANKSKKGNENTPLLMSATESQKEKNVKTVHWMDMQEMQQFNPNQPTASQMTHLFGYTKPRKNPNLSLIPTPSPNTTFFQPAPPLTPLQAPSLQNALLLQHTLPFHIWNNRNTPSQALSRPFPQMIPQQGYRQQSSNLQKGQSKHPFRPHRGRGQRRN
jgi:hypothetical protein